MSITYRTTRNIIESINYYLNAQVAIDWSGTGWQVIKGFKRAYDFTLPIVTVDSGDEDFDQVGIGSTNYIRNAKVSVEVFGRTPTEREDMKDWLISKLVGGCVYYAHTIDNSGDASRVANGRVIVTNIKSSAINFRNKDVHDYDKNRWNLILTCTTGNAES